MPLRLRVKQLPGLRPVERGRAGLLADYRVRTAVDRARRGDDVAAGGAEVNVLVRDMAVALLGAAVVEVRAARGRADGRHRLGHQAFTLQLVKRREPGAVPVPVDVEDVGTGF